jgi:hypothetical protein
LKFTISYYDEKKLPDEIRSIVKSTYYDYSITCVEEIHIDSKIIYIVHMQDDKTWKNVRICDGEMEIVEDFDKSSPYILIPDFGLQKHPNVQLTL